MSHVREIEDADDAAEDEAESKMYLDALINGNEPINRLARLTDSRFGSQTRRTNKLRAEVREGFAARAEAEKALRKDLGPLLEFVGTLNDIVRVARQIAKPIAVVTPVIGTVGGALLALGIVRLPF